ncbi:MAG TPA: polysaccharide deacetylase family protein [Solirubrobacteraceae bacterium]|nr:polysaccharide deacetylase family protein [Solirubrobacteraceae bacterium]
MGRFGPAGLPSALVLTIDNLGEARALERGAQPADAPIGNDPSVTVALPWLLDTLERHRLTATFFVEAINCELYPDALHEIAARGHGLGLHGWRHEEWTSLSAADERDILIRSVGAFAALGLEARGFRPPGGEMNSRSPALLRQAGRNWCSPAGGTAGVRHGLAYVPFAWEMVDAYHLMDSFGALRISRGDPQAALDPDELADRWEEELADLANTGSLRTLVLHPFLMLDERWSTAVERLLGFVAALARERRTWVVAGDAFADWLHDPKPALRS